MGETPLIYPKNNADTKCALFMAVRQQEPYLMPTEICYKGSFGSV